ncbi:hypothetical protein BpHYR1_011148 [Brachionus plicatilis]|uniref:Uncharacterized protein n=1 Tax=Brachionus plicatilis TaxID=10195 RepID=A0A3M7QSS5_BRAPC|nr:hypothetical protein BpHYR1_011148 [Brachionus plicatilis]
MQELAKNLKKIFNLYSIVEKLDLVNESSLMGALEIFFSKWMKKYQNRIYEIKVNKTREQELFQIVISQTSSASIEHFFRANYENY